MRKKTSIQASISRMYNLLEDIRLSGDVHRVDMALAELSLLQVQTDALFVGLKKGGKKDA